MGLLDDAIREHLELKRRHGADASEIARQEREALGPVVRGELNIPEPGQAAVALHDDGGIAVDEEPSFFEKPAERPRAAASPLPPVEEPPPSAPVPLADDAAQNTVAFSLDDLEAAADAGVAPAAQAPAPPPVAPPAPDPLAAAPATPAPSVPLTGDDPTVVAGHPATAPQPPAADPPPVPAERPRAAAAPLPDPTGTAEAPSLDQPVEELRWDAPPAEQREVAADVVPADAEPGEHDELEETPEFLQETPEHDRLWFEQRPPRDFDF